MCQENITFLKKFLACRVLRGRVVFFNVKVARLCLCLPMAQETLEVFFSRGMMQNGVRSWYCGHHCVWVALYMTMRCRTMAAFLSIRLIIVFIRQDVTKYGRAPRPSVAFAS